MRASLSMAYAVRAGLLIPVGARPAVVRPSA
jgi:hypothetical protein